MATSAPNVTILSPTAGSTVYVAQPVSLAGTATDVEDGMLEGASLVRESDLDGGLGEGHTLTTAELSTGEHRISLTATDSGGEQTTVALRLIVRPADVEPAAALSVAPGALSVELLTSATPVTYVVTTRNQSDTALPWAATSSSEWVRIYQAGEPPAATATGATLNDLHITIDPSFLSPGGHEATVTSRAPERGSPNNCADGDRGGAWAILADDCKITLLPRPPAMGVDAKRVRMKRLNKHLAVKIVSSASFSV